MCYSISEGGKRCDYHHPSSKVIVGQVIKTVYSDADAVHDMFNTLRKQAKDYPAPTKKEFSDYIESERWNIISDGKLLQADKTKMLKNLDKALEGEPVSGSGFYALQHISEAMKEKQAIFPQRAEKKKFSGSLIKPLNGVDVGDNDYDNWPLPQADNLDKVSTVVDAINGGATTSDSIGESIDAVDRQGSYYASAAGYIGLVAKHKDDLGVTQFSLTMAGQQFLNLPPEERTVMLSQMIEQTPVMQTFRDGAGNPEELTKVMRNSGLEDSVARRRTASIARWNETLANSEDLSAGISAGRLDTISRVVEASKKQEALRSEKQKKLISSVVKQHGSICPTCFMAMSLSGTCDNC